MNAMYLLYHYNTGCTSARFREEAVIVQNYTEIKGFSATEAK